jgi:hypothetical protein
LGVAGNIQKLKSASGAKDDPEALSAMAAVSAAHFEADLTQRELELVMEDEDVLGGHFEERGQWLYGLAAEIHEGQRFLDQHVFAGLRAHLGPVAFVALFEARLGAAGVHVQGHKTHVVAGVLVFGTGVAQTYDELHRKSELTES